MVEKAVAESGFVITEVVSGAARGVDRLGEEWAQKNNVAVKLFPAQWELHGRGAGHRRNLQMAYYSEALIAIWDGSSVGTEHMIESAKRNRLKVLVFNVALNKFFRYNMETSTQGDLFNARSSNH